MVMILSSFITDFMSLLTTYGKEEAAMLLGVPDEIAKLHRRLERIEVFLTDAERRGLQEPAINHWLTELRDAMYEAQDIIEECMMDGENSSALGCRTPLCCIKPLRLRHRIGNRIRALTLRLEEISIDKAAFNLALAPADDRRREINRISRATSPLVEPNLVGNKVEEDARKLAELLTKEQQTHEIRVSVAIIGMGGIGKTTLAQKMSSNGVLLANFYPMPPIWVCVTRDFSEIELLRTVVRRFGGAPGEERDKGELMRMLSGLVCNQKFLLVLDDVWDARVWEELLRIPLQSCAKGSRVVITTRNEDVARGAGTLHIHNVSRLADEDCWLLLRNIVLCERDERELEAVREVGMKIVSKCKGLPLAIKTTAGILRTRELRVSEWDKVLRNPAWSAAELPDQGLMGVFYLSYDDLPLHLKPCFVYLALFPEDSVMYQGVIVRLWIAEGFIQHNERGNSEPDKLAISYWEELVRRNLLQPDPAYYNGQGCRMHDLLRSLAVCLAGDECFFGNAEAFATASPLIKRRHMYIMDGSAEAVPDGITKQASLRTLMLLIPHITSLPKDFFRRLKCLRILDLTMASIEKLPESIGSLIHLKYLELSKSKIRELPQSIENLQNLHSLILISCQNLQHLPKGITTLHKLINLNLEGTLLRGMPKGVGTLRQLNVLHGYVASGDRGNSHGILQELKPLSKLGHLSLHQLEKASADDARAAEIKAKSHLINLSLHCTPSSIPEEEEIKRNKEVFEELCPPDSLEVLIVEGYLGPEHPAWMVTPSLLPNLQRLELRGCIRCKRLPPLGLLHHLDYLDISGASSITNIGPEFLGAAAGRAPTIYFPKLKHLYFDVLPNWREWSWPEDYEGQAIALPRLEKLVLLGCPKLPALPDRLMRGATVLTVLGVQGAHALEEIKNLPAVENICVGDCGRLRRVSNMPRLRTLQMDRCGGVAEVEGVEAMRHLVIEDEEMERLPEWLAVEGGERRFGALEKLDVKGSAVLMARCFVDGPEWHKFKDIPCVMGYTNDFSSNFYYSRDPYTFFNKLPQSTTADNSGNGAGNAAP